MSTLGLIGFIGMCIGIPLATFGAIRDWRAGKLSRSQRIVLPIAGSVTWIAFMLLVISLLVRD